MSKIPLISMCVVGVLAHFTSAFMDSSTPMTGNILEHIFNNPLLMNSVDDELSKSALERVGKTLAILQPTNFLFTKVIPNMAAPVRPADEMQGRFFQLETTGSETTTIQMLCDVLSTALEDYNELIFRLSEEFDDFVQVRVQQANLAPSFEDQVLAAIMSTNMAAGAAVNDVSSALNSLTSDLGLGGLVRRRG